MLVPFLNRLRARARRLRDGMGGCGRRSPRPAHFARLVLEPLEERLTPAATHTWTGLGANANWTTSANWTNGPVVAGDSLVFSDTGAAQPSSNNNFPAGTAFGSIAFSGSTAYTLTGNGLTLNAGITDTASAAETVQLALTLGASETFSAGNGGLSLHGAVGLGKFTLTVGGTGPATLAGVMSGSGQLAMKGSGTLTLTGTGNTYTGATTVAAGKLADGAADAVPKGTALSVAGGATFDLAGFAQQVAALTGAGVVTDSVAAAIFTVSNSSADSFGGTLTGTLALTKSGAGRLTLSGAGNNYTGATTISAATLADGAANALPTATALAVAGGATFDLARFAQQVGSVTGPGTVTDSGAAATFTANNTSADSFAGALTGSLALTKDGSGTLTLAGKVNTYTGATTVAAGKLADGAADAVPKGTALSVADGATFDLAGFAQQVAALTGAGVVIDSTAAATFTVSNSSADSFGGTLSGTLTGTLALTKSGAGTMALEGSNTYAGGTTVNAGTLQVGASGTLGSGTVAVANGSTLLLGGGLTLGNTLKLTGSGAGGVGALESTGVNTWNGAISLGGASTIDAEPGSLTLGGPVNPGAFPLTVAGNGATAITSVVQGTGGLIKSGLGTLLLSGQNIFSGTTTLNAGTLGLLGNSLPTGGSIGSGSAGRNTLVLNGGTLLGAGSVIVANPITLAGDVTVDASGSQFTLAGATTLTGNRTIAAVDGTTFWAGALGQSGGTQSLTKAGAGTLVLSANETYTGTTRVAAGTLLVDGSLSAASPVLVAPGATLGGIGTIPAGESVLGGGDVIPETPQGNPGTLSTGSVAFASGSQFTVLIAGQSASQLTVTGAVNLGNSQLTVSLVGTSPPALGTQFTIVKNGGNAPVVGTFLGLPEGALIGLSNSLQFRISYQGGGNNVVLTAVDQIAPVVQSIVPQSGGNPTNAATVAFTVTFSENVTGVDTANFSNFSLTTTGQVAGAAVTGVSGSGSVYTVTVATGTGDGTIRLDLTNPGTIRDLAGNGLSGTFTGGQAVTIDKTPPAAPVIVAINPDTGSSSTDGITNDTDPTLFGTAEPGSTVTVFQGGAALGTTVAGPLTGVWVFTPPTALPGNGTYPFTATATDAAGNTSAVSASFTVLVDTTAPTSAVAFHFIAQVYGHSTSPDGTTSVSQVRGGGTLNGATETFTQDNDFVYHPGGPGQDATGTYTATLVDTFPDGSTETLHVSATIDLVTETFSEQLTIVSGTGSHAGVTGGAFTQGSVNADGTFQAQAVGTVFNTLIGSYNAADWGGAITGSASDSGPAGLRQVAVSLQDTTTGLYWDGSGFNSATEEYFPATLGTGGSWSYPVPASSLTDGHTYTVHSEATDAAGNVQATPGSATFVYDITAPATPPTPTLASGGTNVTTPTFTGTAEANSSVQVYAGSTFLGQAVADASGNWTFTVGGLGSDVAALASGTYSITVTATDAAGNVSAASDPLSLTIPPS